MKYAIWLIAAVLTLGMGAIAGHDAEADRQDADALADAIAALQGSPGPSWVARMGRFSRTR